MNDLFKQLTGHIEKQNALGSSLTMFQWDLETQAPPESVQYTSKTIGMLSAMLQQAMTSPEFAELLDKLNTKEGSEGLDEKEKAIVKKLTKNYNDMKVIPPEEYRAYNELIAKSHSVWQNAKANDCFDEFAPILNDIINYTKKFAAYRQQPGQKIYDILLDDYEKGFTVEILDKFFGKIREELVPFIKESVAAKQHISKEYNSRSYSVDKQREFNRFLAEYEGFDFKRGVMAEAEHPFTTNFHNSDVRITTHYYENSIESALFSTIHETGHALYELGIADELNCTPVGGGTSMGAHESQSRFWENIIGRSKSFWLPIWDKLTATFPEQLSDVSLDDFIAGINKPECTLIRTESDELTYPLHILIRYEMEQLMFNDSVDIEKLPEIWNDKYEEYLGVRPSKASEGILQDVHWSGGMLGYFPSYAIGSAVAAQIYYYMKGIMPIDEYLEKGELEPIREFLRQHFHKFGSMKTTNEILADMTGEEFNADYYIKYLKERFS